MLTSSILVGLFLVLAVSANPEESGDEFEGDIILTNEQRSLIDNGRDLALEGLMQRGANKFKRWPGGVVYYTIDRGLESYEKAKKVIASAMQEWSSKTCITFKRRTSEQAYVNFQKGYGCSSNVGRTGSKQPINLASGCWHHGTVVHEIGHALGFWHEQSRPDRDEYVTIMWDNIRERNKFNFKKYGDSSIDSLGVPYDYGSVMHYGKRFFSKNGKDTILTKNGESIGQRNGLSPLDVKQMNLMYKCGTGGGGGTAAPPPTSAGCKDELSQCAAWGSRVCKSGMRDFCKKTCKDCY